MKGRYKIIFYKFIYFWNKFIALHCIYFCNQFIIFEVMKSNWHKIFVILWYIPGWEFHHKNIVEIHFWIWKDYTYTKYLRLSHYIYNVDTHTHIHIAILTSMFSDLQFLNFLQWKIFGKIKENLLIFFNLKMLKECRIKSWWNLLTQQFSPLSCHKWISNDITLCWRG